MREGLEVGGLEGFGEGVTEGGNGVLGVRGG